MKINLKTSLKSILALLLCLLFLPGCKKNNASSAPESFAMETGIYEGTLNNFQAGQNIAKFQVSVSKTGDNTYQVTEVSSGGVPVFTMVDKIHAFPFVNFTIATQTYQNQIFSGSGGVSGGFDALYSTGTKSLYFGIALSSNLNKTIMFNGYKQ
ncbi:MAG TPA: hypothetical protein VNS58_18825 [Puia sp.]|nr:hypothetical protein [Puia sp.]